MKNFLHRSDERDDQATAAERYYGRKFHAKEFWMKFGDYCLSKIPETSKTDKGHHRDECVFLRRDYSSEDAAELYSLKFRKIVRRKYSELSLLPMMEHVIEVINEIADRETRVAGFGVDNYNFEKIGKDDVMTTDDRIKNIMTASMSDFYTSRAAARALIIDDDDDGNEGGAPHVHDIDERLIEGNDEHPNDANTYNGPFGDDDVGPRTFLARRRGAPAASANDGSDDQPSSLVFDISRPDGNKHITAASATSSNTPLGHIDMTSPDSPRPGRHIVALGTFFEWETESNTLDDGPSHDEERDYHYNAAFEKDRTRKRFNDLKAFYAVSRTRNAGMASAYTLAYNISVKEACRTYPSETYASTITEVESVLKRTFRPVDFRRLSTLQRKWAAPCLMLVKAKSHPHTGDFVKLKSRLVACQTKARQDPSQINYPTTPTVSQTALYVVLTIATSKGYVLATGDVPAAYLFAKTNPKHAKLHAYFDRATTKIALDVNPELQAFVDDKGRLWGALDYSLYGLVESGAMWYLHVSKTLEEMGFVVSDVDPCVWFGMFHGEEIILALCVDDIAAAARK